MAAKSRASKAAAAEVEVPEVKAVVASKKYEPIDLAKLAWHRDPTKAEASWAVTAAQVGSVLKSVGVFAESTFDASRIISTEAQRTILGITPSSKKMKMLQHVALGGSVPTVIMTIRDGLLSPVDGLQRLHVFTLVAQGLLTRKHDPDAEPEGAFAVALEKLSEAGFDVTDFDSFVAGFMPVQVWRDLSVEEEDRLFAVLNLDGTAPTKRHMAEMMLTKLRSQIDKLGIKTISEKEALTPDPVTGKPVKVNNKGVQPMEVIRPLAAVNVALYAYLTGLKDTSKKTMIEDGVFDRMHKAWTAYGDKIVRHDIRRFYHELLPALQACYGDAEHAAAGQIRTESEAFVVPVLAAMGVARQDKVDSAKILEWQDSLLTLLDNGEKDPLKLASGKHSWESLRGDLPGSAGQRDRKLTFYGFSRAITNGAPLNWQTAARDAINASK